jgi:hypothetical protein
VTKKGKSDESWWPEKKKCEIKGRVQWRSVAVKVFVRNELRLRKRKRTEDEHMFLL